LTGSFHDRNLEPTAEQKSGRVLCYEIIDEGQDVRLDIFLSSRAIGLSRSRAQALIRSGDAKVNDLPSKPSYKLKAGDKLVISIPPPSATVVEPQEVDFEIIYEDDSIIVLNKPAGIVVHPSPGHATGTLVHGLLKHCRDLSGIGGKLRPGIVHRLDKDTSGLMVAAKNDLAHESLADQFRSGTVQKRYLAIVHGFLKGEGGKVNLPICRHPRKRKEMSVAASGGRRALTIWKKVAEFPSGFSLLSLSLKTGRTHQIRVHLSSLGTPVVGDSIYGYGRNWWKREKGVEAPIHRQMLHSSHLAFVHPTKSEFVSFEAPLPDDMAFLLQWLRNRTSMNLTHKNLDNGKKRVSV